MNQEEFDKIFIDEKDTPSDHELLQYAADEADASTQHRVESALQDDPFVQDALDGISVMQQKENIPAVIDLLNQKLHKDLRSRQKKSKRGIENINLIFLACCVLLLIILIVAYFYFFVN